MREGAHRQSSALGCRRGHAAAADHGHVLNIPRGPYTTVGSALRVRSCLDLGLCIACETTTSLRIVPRPLPSLRQMTATFLDVYSHYGVLSEYLAFCGPLPEAVLIVDQYGNPYAPNPHFRPHLPCALHVMLTMHATADTRDAAAADGVRAPCYPELLYLGLQAAALTLQRRCWPWRPRSLLRQSCKHSATTRRLCLPQWVSRVPSCVLLRNASLSLGRDLTIPSQ